MSNDENDNGTVRPVLDPAQLVRIEAVHRGFLYQHLYAVACLLKLGSLDSGGVLIERDEDIEFETLETIYFLQVKTRQKPLQPNDLQGMLEHFEVLRTEHAERVGDKKMIFAVIANQLAGPKLSQQIESWPKDVIFICPGNPAKGHPILPEATTDLNTAIDYTRSLAKPLPFQSLQSETLIWKLAARVQLAATGADRARAEHRFDRSELSELFESFVDQLQEFPDVPDNYRPQEDEPDLASGTRVRLITGFSGAGKTLWSASQALHASSVVGYFDIRDLPDTAFASSLAREMAARFLSGGAGNTARLPYGTGMDVLAALNAHIDAATEPIMVLDNIHRCRAEIIRDIVAGCSNVKFVLLSQPGEHVARFELSLGVSAERLKGWSKDTLASVFAEHQIAVSPAMARRWHSLTAGLPLYVESAARICRQSYEGNAAQFLEEIEVGEHAEAVAQEIILEQVLVTLNEPEQAIIALLSLIRIPLSREEIDHLSQSLTIQPGNVMRVLRRLARSGLVQRFSNGMWKLHDALAIPAQSLTEAINPDVQQAILVSLRDLLLESLMARQDIIRFAAWTRLLAPTGQAHVLADVAMEEMFHEYGDPADLKFILEDLASDPKTDDETEYWSLEALAFWGLQGDSQFYDPRSRLTRMQEILNAKSDIDPDGPLRIGIKTMMWGGSHGEFAVVRDSFASCRRHAATSPSKMRIARYNYAAALHGLTENRRALPIAEALYSEYYDVLDIHPADVIGANNQQMRDLVGDDLGGKQTDLKHLADCLSLAAKIKRVLGQHPIFLAIHAAKFYHLASAWRSQMKVAQEFADDTLDLGDTEGAVMAMENYVLPLLTHFQFDGEFVEVRSHFAVLLAYNGQIEEAHRQMNDLHPYVDDLPQAYQDGLLGQVELIERIACGEVTAPRANRPPQQRSAPQTAISRTEIKVRRNTLCPCGSGQKYKRCCGSN